MSAATPQQWWEIWLESFEKGDVDRIVALYDPGATVVPNPGNPIQGHDAIREMLQFYADMNGSLKAEQKEILHGPGVATSYIGWSFDADLPGEPLHLEATATVVLADRPDGWVALIDDFFSQG